MFDFRTCTHIDALDRPVTVATLLADGLMVYEVSFLPEAAANLCSAVIWKDTEPVSMERLLPKSREVR